MAHQLSLTMFQEVFFPHKQLSEDRGQEVLKLEQMVQFKADLFLPLKEQTLVVFDFETTGLDESSERIIEIGALKFKGSKLLGEYHTLICPDIPLSDRAAQITGITAAMLQGQPKIEEIFADFLSFIQGSILVAHNARFDWGFLYQAGLRMGYRLSWPCFCTLLLSQKFLPELPSYKLDALAEHFKLSFEARHRSIGDCKVTRDVLVQILKSQSLALGTWADLRPYAVFG